MNIAKRTLEVLLIGLSLIACNSPEFRSADDSTGTAGVAGQATSETAGIVDPSVGGSSGVTSGNAGRSSGGSSSADASTGGSSATGGSTSTGVAGASVNSTGGAFASTGGKTSVATSTGGSSATGGSTFVGLSSSVPAITVTYVVRFSTENPATSWPIFSLTYYNRSNQASTQQTINCLIVTNNAMECRFSVNQALSWEMNVCLNSDCTQTLPRLDATGYCTIGSGVRVYRVNGTSLVEVDSGLVPNKTVTSCNLIIQPGGFALANSLDSDGDSVVDANDCMPKNPSVHPPMVTTDREICGNDLDEDCDGTYDAQNCVSLVTPANTGSVSQTSRIETHWLLPKQTGTTFASTDADLTDFDIGRVWPCQPASVSDYITGKFVQGIRCDVERDPTKEFVYGARVGSIYLSGYVDTCATSSASDCAHTKTFAFRDYITVGGFPYAALDDGKAGFPRSIALSYRSSVDSVYAVVPMQ